MFVVVAMCYSAAVVVDEESLVHAAEAVLDCFVFLVQDFVVLFLTIYSTSTKTATKRGK